MAEGRTDENVIDAGSRPVRAHAHVNAEAKSAAETAATLFVKRRWSIVAGACLVVAALLWLFRGVDAAFVAATLGVVAWFWDQRNRFRSLFEEFVSDEDENLDERENFEADEELDDGEQRDGRKLDA